MASTLPVVDYTTKDYAGFRNDMLAHATTLLPQWTSRSPNDFGVVLVELFAYMGDILSFYGDRVANEAFLETATQRRSVLALARMLDYTPNGASAATVSLTFSSAPGLGAVTIPAGTRVMTQSVGTEPIYFETDEQLVIPADQVAGSVTATEGQTVFETLGTSTGTASQEYLLAQTPVIESSLDVFMDEGSGSLEVWRRVDHFIEWGSADKVYSTYTDEFNLVHVLFGDGVNGKVPAALTALQVGYRVGGGEIGNVGPTSITTLDSSVPGVVAVTNPLAATGGQDAETLDQIRVSAPASLISLNRAVTLTDYESLALKVPGVAKARAQSAVYTNVVIYAAPLGGGLNAQGQPAVLSSARKTELLDYLTPRKPAPTTVTILDPTYVPIDVTIDLVVAPQYNRRSIETRGAGRGAAHAAVRQRRLRSARHGRRRLRRGQHRARRRLQHAAGAVALGAAGVTGRTAPTGRDPRTGNDHHQQQRRHPHLAAHPDDPARPREDAAMASYPGTLREFPLHVNITEFVDASHMNDVQAEVTALQKWVGLNPHVSTAGAGSSLGAWSGTSRTYTSLTDRLANIEAGVAGALGAANAAGGTTLTGTRTFVGPDTFFGSSTGTSSASLYASTGTTGGTATLTFREGTTGRWSLGRTQGANTLAVRDLVNNRDLLTFSPGASATVSLSTFSSDVTVQGDLVVDGTVTAPNLKKTTIHMFTWAPPGEITDGMVLPGMFVAAPAGQTVRLIAARHMLHSGTTMTASVRVEKSNAAGFTNISVTPTAATTDPADVGPLANGAYLDLRVGTVTGAVTGFSLTIWLEYHGLTWRTSSRPSRAQTRPLWCSRHRSVLHAVRRHGRRGSPVVLCRKVQRSFGGYDAGPFGMNCTVSADIGTGGGYGLYFRISTPPTGGGCTCVVHLPGADRHAAGASRHTPSGDRLHPYRVRVLQYYGGFVGAEGGHHGTTAQNHGNISPLYTWSTDPSLTEISSETYSHVLNHPTASGAGVNTFTAHYVPAAPAYRTARSGGQAIMGEQPVYEDRPVYENRTGWDLRLDRSVNGAVGTQRTATLQTRPASMRVVLYSTGIFCYTNVAATEHFSMPLRDSAHVGATAHGFGAAPDTQSGHRLPASTTSVATLAGGGAAAWRC